MYIYDDDDDQFLSLHFIYIYIYTYMFGLKSSIIMINEEFKNVEQQINHRIIAGKKLINVTLVLAHQFIF